MNDALLALYNGSVLTISIFIFVLGAVALKSARSGIARWTIVTFAALAYVALFVGPIQLLSYAKPTSLDWVNRDLPEAEVLHAEFREGDGIYLLLDWYGTPRYYKLPWNGILAQQLIIAMEQAREIAGGNDRPGGLSPEQQDAGGGEEQEQNTLDALLGPIGDEEGEERTPEEREENEGENEGEGEPSNEGGDEEGQEGSQDGQGLSLEELGLGQPQDLYDRQGQMRQEQGQGQGQERGEMRNSGNGKVMMRLPFKGVLTEGQGPSAWYDDTLTPAQFYPAPQPKYPEKRAPK